MNLKKQIEFDKKYMQFADIWSTNSYANRKKVGAIIVRDNQIISDGYNGTPAGFDNSCEDADNVTKPYVLHAEANAITKLARSTQSSVGSTLYVTCSPCLECAKLIIQAGITRVVFKNPYRIDDGIRLLKTAGIKVECLNTDNNG
jgi:dCMP deaminase